MLKNKYVFWSALSVWFVLLAGGGSWFWWRHQHAGTKANVAVSQQSATTAVASSTSTAPYTISSQTPAGTGQTISGSAGGSSSQGGTVAGASTNADVSKLLDPTTFSQYNKYKTEQNAYFIDLQPGTGAALAGGQKAAVYYRGWLTNGQLFDESKAGTDGKLQPFVFTEGQHQVIAGWEQALTAMKVGGVRLLIVPPTAGYGAQAQNGIPANSVLVFQVQLAAIQ